MNSKTTLLALLAITIFAQLFVLSKVIFDNNQIIKKGTAFKLALNPIDPNDPLRGKYLDLEFKDLNFKALDHMEWNANDAVYVTLKADSNQIYTAHSVLEEIPNNNEPFVKAQIEGWYGIGSSRLPVRFPFDRFYLNEAKAKPAEDAMRENRDSTTSYAIVYLYHGKGVVTDVIINGKSATDY